MNWELYEVWQEDEDGHEQLIDTTNSLKEARELAQKTLADADGVVYIYRETEEAHYRLSPEPFKPSQFGFDYAELRHAESITHAIRARGQA